MSNRSKTFSALAADGSTSGTLGRASYAAVSWIGSVRKSNQDSFGVVISADGQLTAAVADGMGGHAGGDVASTTAISMLIEDAESENQNGIRANVDFLIDRISDRLREIQELSPQYSGMGTTLSALTVETSNMTVAHIGDSRIYRFRNGKITQLTKDHSWVQQQIDAGLLNPEQAKTHPRRNVVTRALGAELSAKADVETYRVEINDRILICSDGVHGVVSGEILEEALADDNLDRCLEQLLSAVRKNGASDNATAILISIDHS